MGSVSAFRPTPEQINALWERHRALSAAVIADPALLRDRAHMEAMVRARKSWETAFERSLDAVSDNI